MKNHSFCLRNSEHVANYIIQNKWYSTQMDEKINRKNDLFGGREPLITVFKPNYSFSENANKYLNVFPSDIKPMIFKADDEVEKIYTFINDSFKPTDFSYFLDSSDDTFNVLVLGPTGAGKSDLINVLFIIKTFAIPILVIRVLLERFILLEARIN